MGKIARYLNQLIIGNVFDTPDVLEAYATDRSALKVRPKLVALPESTEDVRKIMRFCYQLAAKNIKIPVTVWGSGLDETGADLGNGLIVSTEKLNRLLESDRRERLVRVQAGITLKELNTALSLNGLTIPVGGHDQDTIGGLISSCPADGFSGKYGGIMNYVERAEVVLANGEILQTNRLNRRMVARKAREKSLEGNIYKKMAELTKDEKAEIEIIRKGALGMHGYPTVARAEKRGAMDLLPLFFGAEGTLGIITEVILRAVPLKTNTKRAVATFEDFATAAKFLDVANGLKPRELEIYDISIIKAAEATGKKLSRITRKMDKGYVIFVKFDQKAKSALRKLGGVRKVLPKSSQLILDGPKNEAVLNEFENSLTSFLNQARSGERVPILTDFYLPGENITHFVDDLKIVSDSLKLDAAIFGSYAAKNYSVRPKFKLDDPDFNKKATTFLRTGAFIIKRQGGSLTGGTPEGRLKALVTNDELTEDERKLYNEIKTTFDTYGILNPGVKLGAEARFTVTHFRDDGIRPVV